MDAIAPLVNTYPQYPFEITHGSGAYVTGSDGNTYLDLYGGHAVCALGHNHPRIQQAIACQSEKLFFYSNLTRLSIRNKAAEALLTFANNRMSSLFFCNSGAEANENALKLAVQLTGRSRIVAFKGGWHGRTTMAAAATDDPSWHAKTPGWTGNVLFLEPNNIAELEKIDQTCAAVIIEPIQSIGGVNTIENEFLIALRQQTSKTGTLLIFDEVQTGVGRTGVPYVNGHGHRDSSMLTHGIEADMSTTAKSLANGFPVGAVLFTAEIAQEIALGDLGSTFGGGPLASAAVLETISIISNEHLMERVQRFEDAIRSELSCCSLVQEIRGHGCLLGLVLSAPAQRVVTGLRDKRILAGTSGVSNVMRLLPSYQVEETHAKQLAEALADIGEGLT
ncbi:aminotransferase class III-fold pyridoxal phosphate-dependent enzyme [bacterium]|nr:aminotransferase class III-fold pyridoxal phosphate-dependent enzyme [bacterium]